MTHTGPSGHKSKQNRSGGKGERASSALSTEVVQQKGSGRTRRTDAAPATPARKSQKTSATKRR